MRRCRDSSTSPPRECRARVWTSPRVGALLQLRKIGSSAGVTFGATCATGSHWSRRCHGELRSGNSTMPLTTDELDSLRGLEAIEAANPSRRPGLAADSRGVGAPLRGARGERHRFGAPTRSPRRRRALRRRERRRIRRGARARRGASAGHRRRSRERSDRPRPPKTPQRSSSSRERTASSCSSRRDCGRPACLRRPQSIWTRWRTCSERRRHS